MANESKGTASIIDERLYKVDYTENGKRASKVLNLKGTAEFTKSIMHEQTPLVDYYRSKK